MSRLPTPLSHLPMRAVALLGAILLGVIVLAISKLFPGIPVRPIAIVSAFIIALIFAFNTRPPRRQF